MNEIEKYNIGIVLLILGIASLVISLLYSAGSSGDGYLPITGDALNRFSSVFALSIIGLTFFLSGIILIKD